MVPTKQQVAEELIRVIQLCEDARNAPNAYSYLPDIIMTLQEMRDDLTTTPIPSQEVWKREASGLARIVLDYGNFAESELGTIVGKVVNRYCDLAED